MATKKQIIQKIEVMISNTKKEMTWWEPCYTDYDSTIASGRHDGLVNTLRELENLLSFAKEEQKDWE